MLSAALIAGLAAGALRGASWNGQSAFEDVRLYDAVDLPKALSELAISGRRVAVVIYGGGTWSDTGLSEQETILQRTLTLTVMVCDAADQAGSEAIYGGDGNPGVLTLQELVVNTLAVQLGADIEHTRLVPTRDSLVMIAPEDQPDAGRKVGIVEFNSTGEILRVAKAGLSEEG